LFQSFSSDLLSGDFDNSQNIFALSLGSADQDADGLPDDWEWTWFGTLARDGTGDLDGDGFSDRQEFLAGTNPANPNPALRILTLDSFSGGRIILWSSVPGKTYQVQFKNDLSATNWTNLGAPFKASGSTPSVPDPAGNTVPQRFYRVMTSL
jgi:hypothetical protein